ncbi:MAG: hypothetical protein AAFR36_17960, partial [Bacteroidota bacterium]
MPVPEMLQPLKNSAYDIIYQYYEKFGFTEVCEHNRMLIRSDSVSKLLVNWNALPVSKEDVILINQIANKIDTLSSSLTYSIYYRHKDYFSDVMLTNAEYVENGLTADSLNLNLEMGYYYF